MEKEYYVYVIYRKDNDEPFYVGKGKGQRYGVWHNRNEGYRKVRDEYGAYHKILFSNLTEEEAFNLEEKTISELRELYELTNISAGGMHGNLGLKMNETHRKKVSEAVKRQWDNPETRERLVASRRKTHGSAEYRKKISEIQKGKKLTEEHKKKIKEAVNNPDIKDKMVKGMSKYHNIKVYDKEGNLLGTFENTRSAKDWLEEITNKKIHISSMINVINGKRKTCGGFKVTAENKES